MLLDRSGSILCPGSGVFVSLNGCGVSRAYRWLAGYPRGYSSQDGIGWDERPRRRLQGDSQWVCGLCAKIWRWLPSRAWPKNH